MAWGILIPWSGNLSPQQWAWDPLHSFKTLSQCNSVFSSTLFHKIPSICFPESLSSICSTPEIHLALSGFPLHSHVGIVGVYLIHGSWSFAAWCALFWWLLFHIYSLGFFVLFLFVCLFSGKRVNWAPVTPKQSFWLIL